MPKKKILLCKLPYKDSHYSFYYDLPAGLAIISEALRSNNIEHEIYDLQINNSPEAFYAKAEKFRPDYIGFSMMTFKYLQNYQLINSVKQKFSHIPIVVGGPHASTFKEKVLEECSGVDIVGLLEGEDILVELGKGKPLEETKGLFIRKNNRIVYTGNREFIDNLDRYPFPKLSKFDLKYYEVIPIITSRGCPYGCIYCPVSTTIGKKWRPRSAERIVDELEYWYNRGRYNIEILDDNFAFDRQRVVKICEGIIKRGLDDKLKISMGNGIRADTVDKKLLQLMKTSGFYQIAFGVESGSDRVLKILNKGEDLQTIEEAIRMSCELGFRVILFFLIGIPGETESEVYQSIRLAKKYPVAFATFYHLIPFPDTYLYKWVEENGRFRFKTPRFLNDASHWINEPLFTTDEIGVDKRKQLYELANKEAKKHSYRVASRRLARRFNLPHQLIYPLIFIVRSQFANKYIKSTLIWQRARNVLNGLM